MRFIVDAQLPPRLARWLGSKGHEAAHVLDLDLADSSDHVIAQRAVDQNAIVVTKDADFVHILRDVIGCRVLRIKFGNTSASDLIACLEPVWPQIEEAFTDGQALVDVDR